MNITEQELEKLPLLNLSVDTHNNGGYIYIVNNKVIYKVFRDFYSFQDEVERNVDFRINMPIPNTPQIYDKIYINGSFSGYIMEFIPDSLTFRNAIGKNLDLKTKIKAINDIYKALSFLHQNNIYLGDIHSDNFLVSTNGNGYLIDLDYMRFPGDEYKFQQCYLIMPDENSNKINLASKYTDNIKTMISSLSLLLDMDLEIFISKETHAINIKELYNKVIAPLNNHTLDDYFKRLENKEDVEYFSTLLPSLDLSNTIKRK